jgi:hypothetical protein
MTLVIRRIVFMAALVALAAGPASAQDPPLIPLQVQIVVSTYDGQELVSSLPYALTVTTNAGPAQLRMGSEVPIAGAAEGSFNYRTFGTNIDCRASTQDGERFVLNLTIDDSAARVDDRATPDALRPTVSSLGVFRSFRSSNSLVLTDGQTQQFTAAADRVTGEVVRVDVTLSVLD